jgi:hypothetical protein
MVRAEGETKLNWLTSTFMAFSTLSQRPYAVGRTRWARSKADTKLCVSNRWDPVQYSGDFQDWPVSVLSNSCLPAAVTLSWEWKVRAGTRLSSPPRLMWQN